LGLNDKKKAENTLNLLKMLSLQQTEREFNEKSNVQKMQIALPALPTASNC